MQAITEFYVSFLLASSVAIVALLRDASKRR